MFDSCYNYHEGCVPLATDVDKKDDIDNQSAVKIAKECDPNGVRTIGSSYLYLP